jgi:hypothetical protein
MKIRHCLFSQRNIQFAGAGRRMPQQTSTQAAAGEIDKILL